MCLGNTHGIKMLHNWYFKDKNPIFEFHDLRFSIQLFTDTNRYDLDKEKCIIKKLDTNLKIICTGLQWAGGQEDSEGECEISVIQKDNKYLFDIKAKKDEYIKRVKIRLYNQPLGTVVARRRYDELVNEIGTIFRYPNGWDDLFTPLITIKNDKFVSYYRSLDKVVRPKTFMVQKNNDFSIVEMIFEEDARNPKKELEVPTWEIGKVNSVEEIFEKQRLYVEKIYDLKTWEKRKDVPDWARNISLILSIHAMHWSGYIYNNYQEIIDKLEWFSQYVDPKNVLVYIPGFDGRYYYKYPNYDPDERLGGEKGLKKLIKRAHEMGYHLMMMFMINGAHPKTEGFDYWGIPSMYKSSNGYLRGVGSCDWDTSRGYDLGCGVGLNPGAPLWQDYFVNEVCRQVEKYKYDSIFLDLAAIYINDPVHSTYDGAVNIINRIHEKHPNLLISTEGWYDALTPVFPFSQCAGKASPKYGEMIYHDTPYAKFFDEYNRSFGHLCLGDLANGYNGVFEWGVNLAERSLPVRKGIIPTLTILDNTIELAKDKIIEALELSKEYQRKFLK